MHSDRFVLMAVFASAEAVERIGRARSIALPCSMGRRLLELKARQLLVEQIENV